MGPPSRPDPLNLLRQRSQSYHAKPAPSQPNPGSPYPGYPPPQQLRTLNAALPSSSQSLQSQESQLFTLPKSIQPPNRAVSQASMREGAGWQGLRKVDSYRPSTPAPIPKSAADVYVQDSQPVVPKGDRILTAVESMPFRLRTLSRADAL